MRSAWTIGVTTLVGILRNKIIVVVLVVTCFMFAFPLIASGLMRLAQEAGEEDMARGLMAGALQTSLGFWEFVSYLAVIYLAATAVWSEVRAGTLVSVLAKPISRAEFLAGKAGGIAAFGIPFAVAGVLLGRLMAELFDVTPTAVFWVGAGISVAQLLWAGSLALLLGVIAHPVIAVMAAVILPTLPLLLRSFQEAPSPVLRWLAWGAYSIGPASLPTDLVRESFRRSDVTTELGLPLAALAENVLYALVLTAIACLVFARREVPVRERT